MAQTGFTPILHYASGTTGAAPDPSFLTSSSNGAELALNYTDGKLFYKDNAGAVQVLAWKTTPVTAGGTGLTSLTAGYVPFGSGTSALGNSSSFTYTTGTSTLAAPVISASTSMASAGNMLFSGTATRIQGDFSNVTVANRTSFQDKTTNNTTSLQVLPNGTAVQSGINCFNTSDPTNSAYGALSVNASSVGVFSSSTGSGTTLPLTFNIGSGGTEVARFQTNGNLQFSGTGQRIQGDFSNATYANRTAFQDKTTNNPTGVAVLPNGTSQIASFSASNNSDPTNAAYLGIGINSTTATLTSSVTGSGTALPLTFLTGASGTEAARFGTDGSFLINCTTIPANGGHTSINNTTVGRYSLMLASVSQSGTYYFTSFKSSFSSGSNIGSILSSDGSTVSYNTTSDYRLKENVQPMTGALARVQALNPVTYTWKSTGQSSQGFIAHELQAIIPEAVSGVKDDIDDQGNPRYQGIDTSFAVATLVAAIKELTARVATLEAK